MIGSVKRKAPGRPQLHGEAIWARTRAAEANAQPSEHHPLGSADRQTWPPRHTKPAEIAAKTRVLGIEPTGTARLLAIEPAGPDAVSVTSKLASRTLVERTNSGRGGPNDGNVLVHPDADGGAVVVGSHVGDFAPEALSTRPTLAARVAGLPRSAPLFVLFKSPHTTVHFNEAEIACVGSIVQNVVQPTMSAQGATPISVAMGREAASGTLRRRGSRP